MKILVSNDDGYLAPGIIALAEALRPIADVVVVAPDSNRSGSSNSLTLDRPLSVHCAENGFYFVNGTPSDCVHVALTGGLSFKPDLIVSGINQGQNMGDDTLYSGTVAAATVPEYKVSSPMFCPWLIPDTMRSGRKDSPPVSATCTQSDGVPLTK